MDYPSEGGKSLYDYTDKSVQHAGYAAVAYAVIALFSALLTWIQYFFYHRLGTGGVISFDSLSQRYVLHTPRDAAVTVAFALVMATVAGVLAFFILRRSRFAIVAMLVLVIVPQLFLWFVAHSPAGSLASIIVVAFLLRGARRIFQDYAERQAGATTEV